jgi:hypothetical protein
MNDDDYDDVREAVRRAIGRSRRDFAVRSDALVEASRRGERLRRHRRITSAVGAVAVGSLLVASGVLLQTAFFPMTERAAQSPSQSGSRPGAAVCGEVTTPSPTASSLGEVALLHDSALKVVDLESGDQRVVVPAGSDVRPPVEISSDGEWVGFGHGLVVPIGGGDVCAPLNTPDNAEVSRWTWAFRGSAMAAVTQKGGVVIGGPAEASQSLAPDGWGATAVSFDPSSRYLAVSRFAFTTSPEYAIKDQGIWLFDLVSGTRTEIVRIDQALARPDVVTWSPDGQWILYWVFDQNSASLAADGVELRAVPAAGGDSAQVIPSMLPHADFITTCANRLAVTAGGGRELLENKGIVLVGPPDWAPAAVSLSASSGWVWPTCSADGQWLAATGSLEGDLQARSVLAKNLGDQQTFHTRPRADETDDAPRWSLVGDAFLFVRSQSGSLEGELELSSVERLRQGDTDAQPVAAIDRPDAYYGYAGWSDQFDWWSPPPG